MNESDHTIRELFKISEERERKINCQRAAIFGAIFMLIGVCLDMVVYPELLQQLLVNRVITAALLLTFAVLCGFIKNNALMRLVAHMIAMIPIVSISLMIFQTDGVQSHYYGGLNLVLVGATLLLRWNTFDSAINVLLCLRLR
jgi:two-component system sensor histidine kinase PhcS